MAEIAIPMTECTPPDGDGIHCSPDGTIARWHDGTIARWHDGTMARFALSSRTLSSRHDRSHDGTKRSPRWPKSLLLWQTSLF
eukprot:gene10510-biopygen10833